MKASSNERLAREGGCLALAWGPPWNWRPSFQPGVHGTWSITWLWWGIYYVPCSMGKLLFEGAYLRCSACEQHAQPDYLRETTDLHGHPALVCERCYGLGRHPLPGVGA